MQRVKCSSSRAQLAAGRTASAGARAASIHAAILSGPLGAGDTHVPVNKKKEVFWLRPIWVHNEEIRVNHGRRQRLRSKARRATGWLDDQKGAEPSGHRPASIR